MGFFSSIVDFVKSVVSSIVTAIANLFKGVFGSSKLASLALAAFVLACVILQPQLLAALLESPWMFLIEHPIYAAMLSSAITTAASAYCPALGRMLGYVFGVISFIATGINVYNWYTGGELFAKNYAAAAIGMYLDVDMVVLISVFEFATVYSMTNFALALADGPDSPYLKGFLDGFFVIPEKIADAADGAIESATSSLLSLLMWCGLGYVGYKVVTKDDTKVVVQNAQEPQNGAYLRYQASN